MENNLFEDLMTSCNEIIEYQNGNLNLKTTTLEISDDELEQEQLFYQKFGKLPKQSKEAVIQYIDELLQVSGA